MENVIERPIYKTLLVSPFNNRRKINALIQQEINHAKQGRDASVKIKINNLVDAKIIAKLYEASNAGVKIQMIVRGVCSLVPGVKNQSSNIEVVSIVDRFLEHARFFIFENNGKPLHFLTSADLMERNLDRRIEVGTPILDADIKKEFDFIFSTQWNDNQKSRIIDKKLRNTYKINTKENIRSQYALYNFYEALNDDLKQQES
jgi:polyphosphate kinase